MDQKTLTKIGTLTAAALLIIAGLFLVRKFVLNRSFLTSYARAEYEYDSEKALLTVNAPQGYLPHYNMGNAAYEQKDYDSAVIFYQRALTYYIPEGEECDVRVNLALAMIGRMDFKNLNSQEKIEDAIEELQRARNILTEKGCADPEGTDGHDPEAILAAAADLWVLWMIFRPMPKVLKEAE